MALTINPNLCLIPSGYKASKLYSVLPTDGTGDLDVVRATTATRVNSIGLIESVASNVPRLDYTNGSCPSLLVEPQRTNLLTYSEQFDDASWFKNSTTITPNATTSPDGTVNAYALFETAIADSHHIMSTLLLDQTTTDYTFSFFVKPNGRTKGLIQQIFIGGTFPNVTASFDLVEKTITNASGGGGVFSNTEIKEFDNGWFRVSISGKTLLNTDIQFRLYTANSDGDASYLGDVTKGLYIWGAQLEQGSYATSYIPTTSESVTRNADVISKTGVSDLIGQTEGVVFMDFVYTANDTNGLIPILLSNTATNQLYLWVQTDGRIFADFYFGGSTQASISTAIGFAQLNTRYKIAMAYKANDFAFYINGQLVGTDSSGSVSGLNRLDLDYNSLASTYGPSGQYVNSVALWKTRLTNTELAEITSL
jgi:hypothetical protein